MFTTPSGTPIRQNLSYRRHFKPAVREALPEAKEGCRFHDLRHTCAALLIEQGVGLLEICRHLGHKSVATTGDVYGHLYEDAGQRMAAALDEGWREAGQPGPGSIRLAKG